MNLNKKSKIFIAGHKGMVGSAIKKALTNKGYKNLLFASKDDLDLLDFVFFWITYLCFLLVWRFFSRQKSKKQR